MTVALEIKNVSHNFGNFTALDDVSLNINPGDFTVLLGLNGAGKTTLYSLITRLYNNNSGTIKIYGFDVRLNSVNALKHIGVASTQMNKKSGEKHRSTLLRATLIEVKRSLPKPV